jgi:hypothetical protein
MFSIAYDTSLQADDSYGYAMGTQTSLLAACYLGDSARPKSREQGLTVFGLSQLRPEDRIRTYRNDARSAYWV